jgi:hypothetical protein
VDVLEVDKDLEKGLELTECPLLTPFSQKKLSVPPLQDIRGA